MEGTDKPLTRDALVSMQVIDAKGRLIGKVKDVSFEVGKPGISLAVETEEGKTKNVAWEEIQAASDFIILKPTSNQAQPTQETKQEVRPKQGEKPLCPTCGKPLTWIGKYKRWYCYHDKKYV